MMFQKELQSLTQLGERGENSFKELNCGSLNLIDRF